MALKLRKISTTGTPIAKNTGKGPSSLYMGFYNLGLVKRMAKSYQEKLMLAGSTEDPVLFAARTFFFTLVGLAIGLVLMIFGGLILFKFYLPLREPKFLAVSLMMIMFGLVIPVVTYFISYLNVSQAIDSRKNGLNAETFAFSAVFIIFLRSGLSTRVLFERIPKVGAFQYISQLMLYGYKRMKYLGESVEDAFRETTKVSPSKLFNDFISTYITAVRTGAPVIETMEAKVRALLREFELLGDKAAENLSGVGEGYVIWLASGYIMIFLVLILEAVFPQLGGGLTLGLMGAVAVVLIPMVNLVFVFMADSIQLKFPERKLSSYKVFYVTFPIGMIVTFVILALQHQLFNLFTLSGTVQDIVPTSIAILIGLLIASVPPAIVTNKELREGTGYDQYVVNLLRAISEGLRAGLSPEAVIRNLKDSKEMGKLRDVLRAIVAYVNLGYPLKDAIRKGADRINDFTSKIALLSLADMLDIGSLTPETVEVLAQQIDSQILVRSKYLSKVKILMATPYVGVVIALIASIFLGIAVVKLILVQSFSYGPLVLASELLPKAVYISAVSSIYNAYFAGFLVGKLGSGKMATGFLHSIILAVVTTVMLIVMLHVNISFVAPSSSSATL